MTAGDRAGAERDRFPWPLGVAVVAWVLFGGLLLASALTASRDATGPDQGSVDAIRSALGESAVASRDQGHPTLLLIGGLLVLLLALLLLLGQGWSRYPLVVLGVLAVIGFAWIGRWEAIAAFAALVLGTVPLLSPTTHRYLAGQPRP